MHYNVLGVNKKLVKKLKQENKMNPAFGISMSIKNGMPDFTHGWRALDVRHLASYDRSPVAAPVPPTLFLFGTGLVGTVVMRKRMRS
jgi:hypothetical protein